MCLVIFTLHSIGLDKIRNSSPPINSIFTISFPEPCAPQNVKYSGNRQSAVLSWEASVFATSYTVYNVSSAGRVKVCTTTGRSCSLTNFDPRTIEVTASNAVGESNPTSNITGQMMGEKITSATQDSNNNLSTSFNSSYGSKIVFHVAFCFILLFLKSNFVYHHPIAYEYIRMLSHLISGAFSCLVVYLGL